MTRSVHSVAPDLSIREAMGLLSSRHISGAPVMVGDEVVGVITSTDLMSFAAELSDAVATRNDQVDVEEVPATELEPQARFFTELWDETGADSLLRFANTSGPALDVLDVHTVEEAMTRAPIHTMRHDATLPAAAEFMRSHGIHRVFVTEKGKLVGIVTSTDIANAVASHKLRESQYVFGKEAHFTGQRGGPPAHRETTLGGRLEGKQEAKPSRRPNRRGT
jgi:CBS domain-containing protein